MTIDINKIRPGDKVTLVPLEVTCVDILCGIKSIHFADGSWTFAENLAAHHPAPREFQVGDRVRLIDRDYADKKGTVEAVVGNKAWVNWDIMLDKVHLISTLTLVEGRE